MKLTIFAILLLVFMVGLTMVQGKSNIETQFEVLSAAEMQSTQGLGACEQSQAKKNVGNCTSSKCTDVTFMGIAVTSSKTDAEWHIVCGPQDLTKDCVSLLDVVQICAKKYIYAWGGCAVENQISVFGKVIPAIRVVDGCGPIATGSAS